MPGTPDEEAYNEPQFLCELAAADAPIAGDIAKIDDGTWAIHGAIQVDGEAILAEFTTEDEARTVLDHLPATSHDSTRS
jgi:hypothetical protein